MSRMEIDSAVVADVNDKMEMEVDINPVVDQNDINKGLDLDEDIAEEGCEGECSFVKLPSEIMVKIFNHLSQKDIIQARKCSSELRCFVDKYMDFYAIIHDEKTDLSRIYQLRIKDCLITRYLKDTELFQFPQVLRRLRFWGPITGHNFRRILRVAVDNEEMSFTRFALGQDNLFLDNEDLPGFGKLKTLELLGYTCRDTDSAAGGSIEVVTNNANNILSYKMPFIKKLAINFNCYREELDSISEHFFNFLASHKSIENLNASLVPVSSEDRRAELRNNNNRASSSIVLRSQLGRRQPSRNIRENNEEKWRMTPEIIDKLKEIQLKYLRLATSPYDYSKYEALIENQRNLVDFRVRWTIVKNCDLPNQQEHQRPIGISWTLYKTPILASASTLTCVDLKGITLPVSANHFETPFDASIFSQAQNLRRLVLHRSPDDRSSIHYLSSMINIINIPDSVQEFEIVRFKLLSSDLQILVDALSKLTSITLSHTGSYGDFGVHGGIIKSIMEHPTPTIKTMSITCINFCNKEEKVKYEEMKKKYKFTLSSEEHLHFDFERYRKGEEQPKYMLSPRPTLRITETFSFSGPSSRRSAGPSVIRTSEYSKNRKLPHRKLREWVRTSGLYSDSSKNHASGLFTLLNNSSKAMPQFVNYNPQQTLQQNGCCSISVNNVHNEGGPSSSTLIITDTTTTTTATQNQNQATASTSTSTSSQPHSYTFVTPSTSTDADADDESEPKETPTIIFRNGRYFIADDNTDNSDSDSTINSDEDENENDDENENEDENVDIEV